MLSVRKAVAALAAVVVVQATTWQSAAQADDLAKTIPSAANAIAVVDVKGLVASPIGQKEAWQGKLVGGYAQRPLAVPAYAERMVLAGSLSVPELSPVWQLGVIDSSVKVNLEKVARDQKGVLDTIGGKTAVTTKFDVIHVALTDTRIGTLWPARRALATQLLAGGGMERGVSAYLAKALAPDAKNQVVMALDLSDAFSGASIRQVLAMGGLQSLDQVDDFRALSDRLASVAGVTARIHATDALNIELTADFASSPMLPAAAVKPFCLEMLSAAGLPPASFADLAYEVKGNQIVATGTIAPSAAQALLSLLVPETTHTSLESGVAAAAPAEAQPAAESADPKAVASKQYYTAIANVLDSLTAGQSMAANATKLRTEARRIQQLPVLNVDPALVAWGADVVSMMNQVAMVLGAGQANAQNAAAGIASPIAESHYSESGYSSSDTAASRAEFRNAQLQRRQAAQTERVNASNQAFQIVNGSSKARAEIRAAMTQKFGIEF